MVSRQERLGGVKVQTLPAQVASRLVDGIVSGRFGEHAPSETEICDEFQVSRAVARDALKLLASLDVVEISQGKRVMIRPREQWDYLNPSLIEWLPDDQVHSLLQELHSMRIVLEPELAAMAALSADEEALQRMHSRLERMAELQHDPERYLEADYEFHMEICRAANNRILDRIMYSARWLLTASRRVTNEAPGALGTATQHHNEIFDALQDGDADAARSTMRAHLEETSPVLAAKQEKTPRRSARRR